MPLESALFDAELKNNEWLKRYKTVDSVAKGLIELNKFRNERSGVKPLSAESTPEDIAAFRGAMGVPEKPDGYTWQGVEFPEDIAPSEEQFSHWRQVFHEAHLAPAQVQKIMEAFASEQSRNYLALEEAEKAELTDADRAFAKRYGGQAPHLIKQAEDMLVKKFGKDLIDSMANGARWNKSSLGHHPVVIEMALELSKYTGHDNFYVGDGRGGRLGKEAALQDIAALRVQHKEGRISTQEFNERFGQLAQIAYSDTP
jgi:hypothetical protein